jgi:hypothetical protein
MRAHNVHVGDIYEIRISGKLAQVRLTAAAPGGGYFASNVKTGRIIRLKSGRRLRYNVTLFELAKTALADLAAGNPNATTGRAVRAGDFDGCEAELQRLEQLARARAAFRLLTRPTETEEAL